MPEHRHGFAAYAGAGDGYIGDWDDDTRAWHFKLNDRFSDPNQGYMDNPYGVDNPDPRAKAIRFAGGGRPHNNLPPYYALTYIIKY
ncbi:MAG: hypothetical protein HZY76_05465 [Anaerolineae bacterium]|nr:MAG: hypothetical protein HZY76_05465 [Anaerolineae bacterium]